MQAKGRVVFEGFKQGLYMALFVVFLFFGYAGVGASMSDRGSEFVIEAIVLLGIAAVFAYLQHLTKRTLVRFREYVTILSNEPVKTLNRIAEVSLFTNDVARVRKDVEKMINKRLFVNAYINDANEVVVVQNLENVDAEKLVTVVCESCGGVNQGVPGRSCTCAFCGAHFAVPK